MTTTKKFNTFCFNSKIVCLSLIIFLLVLFFAFTDNHETRSDFQSQTHSSSVIVAIKMLTPSFVTRLSAEIIYNAFLLRLLSLATLPVQHLTVLNTFSFHVGCKHAKRFGLCSPLNSWGGSSHILFETKSCSRPSTSKKRQETKRRRRRR